MDRQQALSADGANHRIHLDNSCNRILLHKDFEFLVGMTDSAAYVGLEFYFLAADTEPGFSGEINAADFQKTVIDLVSFHCISVHPDT